ncbi:MAG TPA: hypothetical protein VMU49_06675 [Candidatus Acidoferrales bacterium]|nr:hypothetical protein [Candidatus Acidoferrales bacterium]
MSKFKRVSLAGSEELFRPTRPELVPDVPDTITEMVDRRPAEQHYRTLHLTSEEVELLLEAIQAAKYPDRARSKLPLDTFERYDGLRAKLQGTRDA